MIFDENDNMPDDAGMADMFRIRPAAGRRPESFWETGLPIFVGRRLLEDEAIGRAVSNGRGAGDLRPVRRKHPRHGLQLQRRQRREPRWLYE